ncbi:MAG: hypothetical protein WC054_01455 [Candidatus Nanopelagicales bacterium]
MTNTTAFPEFMSDFVIAVGDACTAHGLSTPSGSLSGIWTRYDGNERFLTVSVSASAVLGAELEVKALGFRGEPDLVERRTADMLFPVAGTDDALAADMLDWLDDTLADAVALLRRSVEG